MLLIGSHVSFDKDEQLLKSTKEAISYGSSVFMFYTGAPQNTNRCSINNYKTIEAINLMKDNNIDYSKVIVHAPYIINLANDNNFDFNVSFLNQELNRCSELGISKVVLHPGSHVNLGVEAGIKNIIKSLNYVFSINDTDVCILLETMAGKGTELGKTIDEVKEIIDGIENKNRIGVCLDTCHLNDSGYDVSNFDLILDEIDKKIGLDKVLCVHVNDSKNDRGTHKDRHENIGYGTIGFNNLINIIYNKRLENVPKILETPYIDKMYQPFKHEIDMIKNKKFNENLFEDVKRYYLK